ncbi:hypothetical protein BKA81DRAFT_30753 [Phyllosticta paracitricarpa]
MGIASSAPPKPRASSASSSPSARRTSEEKHVAQLFPHDMLIYSQILHFEDGSISLDCPGQRPEGGLAAAAAATAVNGYETVSSSSSARSSPRPIWAVQLVYDKRQQRWCTRRVRVQSAAGAAAARRKTRQKQQQQQPTQLCRGEEAVTRQPAAVN